MSDLISREETIARFVGAMRSREKSEHPMPLTEERIVRFLKAMPPTTEPNEYVKGGTLTVQMPTIKEAKAIEKIVVYADTYKQEYSLPKVGEWEIEEMRSIYGNGYRLTCSECGDTFTVTEDAFPNERYCRYCGAKTERSE